MKDFRNNLHPAFFNKEVAGESAQEKTPETVIKTETEEALTDLQANIAGGISSEMSSKYSDTEKLKSYRERFTSRIQAKNRNGVKYGQIWSEKIGKGFNDLCTILKKKGLLNEKNKQEIKDLYLKEVHSQYETYIWRAGNNTFNSVKDTIFGKDSKDYPVEKVYKQLTGAVSVSNVDRTNVEGYESEVIDWTGTKDGKNIDMNEGQNIDFLSDDLPQYLWGIRKTPGVLNVLKWLPIFSVKEDRPSKVDRKAIRHFLKISSKIKVEGNKDKALALMELFRDNSVNLDEGRDSYKIALAKHGIKAEEKDIDDIIKAGSFFINTQTDNLSTRDQHAIYLSVLKIIESEGGVKNAVNKFKSIVEQDKTDTKIEKKEGYKSGKLLQEKDSKLYGIAKNLGITDFTAATRLSEKTSEYFWNTPIEKILANLNNDRTIDVRDAMTGGSKSGAQFLEVFNQVGKEKALSNLLKRAKLMNKNLGIGLPDTAFNPKTVESAVKNENTGLILMLQNIISNPREDLYELLSGEVETIDAETLKAADKAATEMISKINKEELEKRGLRLPTPESMQSGLATALYTEYKRGVGLGGKISFDQWIKGVEMNTGFQVRDGGVVMVGIGLDYSKSISLGKGWSANPELSAGAFIPLGTGKIEEVPGSVGFNNEVAKRRITENGIQEHLGLSVGATLMPAGVIVLSAGFKWEQNKAQGIESAEYTKMLEFRDSIMSPILDDIYNTCKGIKTPGATKLNFNDENLSKVYKNSILKIAKKQNVPEKEQKKVVDGVIRALLKYDNYDLSNETTRKIIAQGISEQYAMAWAEDRKAHITDKTYLSSASLGTFRVVGSPLVGLYVGAKVANHNLDGYGDKWGRRIEIDNSKHEGAWDKKSIDNLNNSLGLSENEGIKITDKGLKLPKSLTNKVKVSRDMIGLMVKDTDGSILLSKWTSMGQKLKIGTASQSKELFIGEGKDGGYNNHLDAVGEDWFKKDMEGVDALVLEKGNDLLYTPEKIKEAIQKLKKESKGNLDDFNPTEEQINQLIQQLKRFEKKDKKVKIEVERKSDGTFVMNAKQTEEIGRGIEVEYVANLEMINGKAKEIARAAYTEALRIRKPSSLHSVKHKPWPEYTSFNEAMQSKSYETAKNELKSIFGKLDEQNSGANFTEIGKSLDEIDDINALAQALMSINNIFARSKQVRGGGENYEFKRPYGKSKEMRAIIKERYKILNTIESKIDDEKAKGRYKQLFDATSKYVNNPKNGYAIKSTKAASLSNTVGFNLGDKTNPENPLFNPEIYNPMVDLNSLDKQIFTDEAKNALHKRAMTLFANNEALINPIKKAFHIADNAKVNVDMNSFSVDGEKGKLTLDIGGKKVTLSAGMKFGFFTQCVNHTIILDDISAESDGNKIDFKSGTWKNDEYVPGNKRTILSTTEVGVSLSFIVRDGTKNEEKQDTTTEPEETVREKQDTTTDPLENTKDNNPGSNDNSQNTNTPPTAGEGDKGGGGGGGRK